MEKKLRIKVKRLTENAVMPAKAHASDAGFDLTATSCALDENGAMAYGTGIAMEIPEGHVGLVFPRSSVAGRDMVLTNCVGVIDSGYRGEIMAKFKPQDRFDFDEYFGFGLIAAMPPGDCSIYGVGERIAQLIVLPIPRVELEEAEELSGSERGTGGYGSSGQ